MINEFYYQGGYYEKTFTFFFTFLLALTLTFSPENVNADDHEAFKSGHNTYDFYATLGTLPTLYAGLNTYYSKNESFMWFERKSTFNTTYLPDNISFISQSQSYNAKIMDEFKLKIQELYAIDPNTKFNFYMDDLRVQFILSNFVENQIPESNYHIYLLSDGTGSYNIFKSLFGAENSLSEWEKASLQYEDKKTAIENGDDNVIDMNNNMALTDSMYYASQYPNVSYWMQFPELLISQDPLVNEEVKKMNTVKISPTEMFDSLSIEDKENFMRAVSIDRQFFDDIFDESSKPNLIISGTSIPGEGETFEDVIMQIAADYSSHYDLFFKPHPSFDPISRPELIQLKRKEFLESKDITLLPAQLPMEALTWAYPDIKIGGYSSSLYMSTAKGQTIFFIADSIDHLSPPLPSLYDLGHFGDAKLYYITKETPPIPEPENPGNGSGTINGEDQITNSPKTEFTAIIDGNIKKIVDLSNIKPGTSNIIIDLTTVENNITVQLTSDLLTTLIKNKHDYVTFLLKDTGYTMPVDILKSIALNAPSSNNMLNEDDWTVELAISNSQNTEAIKSAVTESRITSDVYDFNLILKDKHGKAFDIKQFLNFMNILIKTPDLSLQNVKNHAALSFTTDSKGQLESTAKPVKLINYNNSIYSSIATLTNGSYIVVQNNNYFEDIKNHWASSIIKEAADRLIVNGKTTNSFDPNGTITKAEFIAMLIRALGIPSYHDDNIVNWYDTEIITGKNAGLFNDITINDSNLNDDITRLEIAKLVVNVQKIMHYYEEESIYEDVLNSFVDTEALSVKDKSVLTWMVSNKILIGTTQINSNKLILAADSNSTRAEAVTIILRTLKQMSLVNN